MKYSGKRQGQCQNQDPHDILREIHELTDQGCSVQLPAGEVPSVATTMLDRELCSENGAPITPVSCSASTEYNDACAPTNRLLREIELGRWAPTKLLPGDHLLRLSFFARRRMRECVRRRGGGRLL